MSEFTALLACHDSLLTELGIGSSERESLVRFLCELQVANRDINLVSRKLTPRQLVEGHLLDCLIAMPYLPHLEVIADLGSGGVCLPSHWLFAARKHNSSSMRRACSNAVFSPGYSLGAQTSRYVVRWIPTALAVRFKLVIARAFKPLQATLEMTRRYRDRGGDYLLYKGRRAKIIEELAAAGLDEGAVDLVRLQAVGLAEERHLVLLAGRR